eukprot:scaffold1445_cov100-Isochrysis_galbana.AAC.1
MSCSIASGRPRTVSKNRSDDRSRAAVRRACACRPAAQCSPNWVNRIPSEVEAWPGGKPSAAWASGGTAGSDAHRWHRHAGPKWSMGVRFWRDRNSACSGRDVGGGDEEEVAAAADGEAVGRARVVESGSRLVEGRAVAHTQQGRLQSKRVVRHGSVHGLHIGRGRGVRIAEPADNIRVGRWAVRRLARRKEARPLSPAAHRQQRVH